MKKPRSVQGLAFGVNVPRAGVCYHEIVWKQALRQPGTFLKHIVPAIIKPIHVLWNEVIGFFFLCMATVFGFRTAVYVRQYLHASPAEAPGQLLRMAMAGFCALLLGWYGISSFWRARKISRS